MSGTGARSHAASNLGGDAAGLAGQVHAEVQAHVPGDAREAASRRRILALLAWLPQPLDQTADPIHVTGSAIVHDGAGCVLLHRHRRLRRWLQPGGHLDPGEHPADAARREAAEETGVPLRAERVPPPRPGPVGVPAAPEWPALLHLDVHEGPRGHVHLDLRYLLRAPVDAVPAPAPGESPEVAWFDLPAALAVSDPSLRAALQATARVTTGRGDPR